MLYGLSPVTQAHFGKGLGNWLSKVKWRCGWHWIKERQIVVWKWGLHRCSEAEWREGHSEMWEQQLVTIRISLLLLFGVQYTFLLVFIHCSINWSTEVWGTMLHTGRSQVRLPMRSMNLIQCTQSLRPHHGPRVYSASNRNECQKIFLGLK
jgi:hypothetical protein